MEKKYLTTFQAAPLLSVTPDSILKWIKSGKLEALRTPGGHHRIARESIEALLKEDLTDTYYPQRVFQYCWEFNAVQDNCTERCENCVVYKTRAKYCYKMSDFPTDLGHQRQYCESSCQSCEYYNLLKTFNDQTYKEL
jgi:excisionase family DNA binding protein